MMLSPLMHTNGVSFCYMFQEPFNKVYINEPKQIVYQNECS